MTAVNINPCQEVGLMQGAAQGSRSLDISNFIAESKTHGEFRQQFRSGGALGVEAVRMSTRAFEATTPAVDDFTIGMGLTSNVPSNWNFGDGWSGDVISRPGSALITPAGVSVDHRVRAENDILVLACSNITLTALLNEHGVASPSVFDALVGKAFIEDTALRVLIQSFWSEAAQDRPASGLAADAVWFSIIARLLQLVAKPPKKKSYGLTRKQLARIDTYIDASLSSGFNTKDLAALVNLPLSQFSRDFREATGASPYQYVLSKRLARAQEQLATGSKPLALIAAECGFSSQSHMTDIFREKLGRTPGRFRRDMSQ